MYNVTCLPVNYPLKNYQHRTYLYTVVEVHLVMQFVYRMQFPAKYAKMKSNCTLYYLYHIFPILQYLQKLNIFNTIAVSYNCPTF